MTWFKKKARRYAPLLAVIASLNSACDIAFEKSHKVTLTKFTSFIIHIILQANSFADKLKKGKLLN